MLNIVPPESLVDSLEHQDIFNDIWQECAKFGYVELLNIPRPNLDNLEVDFNVGNAYVKFFDMVSAKKALHSLSGRAFGGRIVVVSYYPENLFNSREFN